MIPNRLRREQTDESPETPEVPPGFGPLTEVVRQRISDDIERANPIALVTNPLRAYRPAGHLIGPAHLVNLDRPVDEQLAPGEYLTVDVGAALEAPGPEIRPRSLSVDLVAHQLDAWYVDQAGRRCWRLGDPWPKPPAARAPIVPPPPPKPPRGLDVGVPLAGDARRVMLAEHRRYHDRTSEHSSVRIDHPELGTTWAPRSGIGVFVAYDPKSGTCVGTLLDPDVAQHKAKLVVVSPERPLTADQADLIRVAPDGRVVWLDPGTVRVGVTSPWLDGLLAARFEAAAGVVCGGCGKLHPPDCDAIEEIELDAGWCVCDCCAWAWREYAERYMFPDLATRYPEVRRTGRITEAVLDREYARLEREIRSDGG